MLSVTDLIVWSVGVAVRRWAASGGFLQDRTELSTPLNSLKRLTEGVHIYQKGSSPYDGVVFHETPLALLFFSFVRENLPDWIPGLCILGDLLTSFILSRLGKAAARSFLSKQDKELVNYHSEATPLLLPASISNTLPRILSISYLFNPYIVANCAAHTTTVWSNLLLASCLLAMMECRRVPACLALALATYQSLYPGMLLLPLCLQLASHECGSLRWSQAKGSYLYTVAIFSAFFTGLLFISAEISGSWDFLNSTFGFILSVPELTPNMGLFWYFFTEMFEHFRLFFVAVFQLNTVVYCVPLAIRFSDRPLLLSVVMVALIAVFKSYPSLGDVGFYLALLPLFAHLLPFMKQTFIIGCMFLATTVLAPIAWQLWIYNNSANANYYFAINLVFGSSQIFLITDLVFAHVKRQFYLEKGFSVLEEEAPNGKKPILQLK